MDALIAQEHKRMGSLVGLLRLPNGQALFAWQPVNHLTARNRWKKVRCTTLGNTPMLWSVNCSSTIWPQRYDGGLTRAVSSEPRCESNGGVTYTHGSLRAWLY